MIKMEAKLVLENRSLESAIVGEGALSILSPERIAILKSLAREPKYPAEMARELKMPAQSLYYHFRQLHEAKLIELEGYSEQRGAIARKYKCSLEALSIVIREHWHPFSSAAFRKPPSFLSNFISGSHFEGKIVLGSPDPHGKFRARASEFCATEFAMMLGNYATFDYPLYYLDTELKEKNRRDNLIVFGGPKVNMLISDINPFLPIYFHEKTFELQSKLSNKKYTENYGVVELIENPFNKGKKILILAGSDHEGTRAAVLALLKERDKIEKGNNYDAGVLAKVVQGFDEDGDGIVDAVEILE
ncbi:MAG TPA: S-layer protein [Candidatus Norongarragalinales archaeon]|nr:S-layer protein [Candidatus Norongarragalinales archaeon]